MRFPNAIRYQWLVVGYSLYLLHLIDADRLDGEPKSVPFCAQCKAPHAGCMCIAGLVRRLNAAAKRLASDSPHAAPPMSLRIEFTLADHGLKQHAASLISVHRSARTEIRRGLGDAGRKVTTQVRRSLKKQMNVRRYGVIVQQTRGYPNGDGLGWTITAYGKGLPIREFKTRVTGRGVSSDPWNVTHLFKRSFASRNKGRLLARLSSKRFPIRSLHGPSPAKELVKDETLSTWEKSFDDFSVAVTKRLRKLTP